MDPQLGSPTAWIQEHGSHSMDHTKAQRIEAEEWHTANSLPESLFQFSEAKNSAAPVCVPKLGSCEPRLLRNMVADLFDVF